MIFFNLLIFLVSLGCLFWASSILIKSLTEIAEFLGWREFVIAFFVFAFIGTAPNFFVGISSALHGIPELSFGDVIGGNLVDLTLAVALATLIARKIPTTSRLVQSSSLFTVVVALLPLLLILDGTFGRGDGIALILFFFFYVFWLFSKKERFTRIYEKKELLSARSFTGFIKNCFIVIGGLMLLLLGAEGLVRTSLTISELFGLQVSLIGIFAVGLGNALPETYFAIVSARKKQTWMILGNLMGAIVAPATLVLGVVALISPIVIPYFSVFAIARIFLIIAAFFFLFFIRSGREITRKEAFFLFFLYLFFVVLIFVL